MNQTELVIEGMTCDACARRVEAALNAMPGVDATVSYVTGTATVRGDAGVGDSAPDRAVEDAGYRVARASDGPVRPRAGDGTELHIVVIGSGGGAFAAAIRSAESGARVTMIECGTLGGTCVNVGCVPLTRNLSPCARASSSRRLAEASGGIVKTTLGTPV